MKFEITGVDKFYVVVRKGKFISICVQALHWSGAEGTQADVVPLMVYMIKKFKIGVRQRKR